MITEPYSVDELEGYYNQRRLAFPQPLETLFRLDYFDHYLKTNQTAVKLGVLIMFLFGIVDYYAMPESFRTVMAIRYLIMGPLLIGLVIYTQSASYRRWIQPVTSLASLMIGCFIIAMVVISSPTEIGHSLYLFGLMPVMVFLYTTPPIIFRDAALSGWIMTGCAQVVLITEPAILLDPYLRVSFFITDAFLITVNTIGTLASYQIERSARRNFIQEQLIENERRKSDILLANILPFPIAERLKRKEQIADQYSDVTVLFADVVDFTARSAKLKPDELINFLNRTFSIFDHLAEKHDVEKIKTIGDNYMAVAGLPIPRPDHAQALAEMALEMLDEISQINEPAMGKIEFRIGLNTGPVVAGVIGQQKFAYDLWGDTVNTASRMESHGLPGHIQVTPAVVEVLKDQYIFEPRGPIPVKGKGMMTTYFLIGRK